MSTSTYIIGYAAPTDKWTKMKAAWDACVAAGVPVPVALEEFFGGNDPEVSIGPEVYIKSAVREWNTMHAHGWDIDLSKLPKEVQIIRVSRG